MTDVQVEPGEGTTGSSRDPGVRRLVQLIVRLSQRPRGKDNLLPIICIARQPEGDRFLKLFDERLSRGTPRQIPHARVDAAEYETGGLTGEGATTQAIQQVLHQLCEKFSVSRFGFAQLRFRRFLLIEWLMNQDLRDVPLLSRRRELSRRLRGDFGRWGEDLLSEVSQQASGTIERTILNVLKLVIPPAIFRARISGRIPGLGYEFRWFMRQQYLAPRQSGNFIGFAERLTKPARNDENSEQVQKLLVHSFLEDLRSGYERRLWRRKGWRRTAYPVALIDNINPRDAGQLLLNLINDVRNESGRVDPLLIVAACPSLPSNALDQHVMQITNIVDVDQDTYAQWAERLPHSRRKQQESTWYLPLLAHSIATEEAVAQVPIASLAPGRPPWWANRAFVPLLCLVLVASLAILSIPQVKSHWNCFGGVFDGRVSVQLVDGACIGFSDSDAYVFSSSDRRLSEAEDRVFAQNRKVEDLHKQQPDRPYLTLIYLGQMTSIPSFTAESEDLEGIAAEQRELINANYDSRTPLLRFIVANVGPQVRYGVATLKMLKPILDADPSIIGMIGLDESHTNTVQVIENLNTLGLPVIATSLSADGLYLASPLYFQIAPPNHEQADLIATAVAQPEVLLNAPTVAPIVRNSRAYIYYQPNKDDLYTSSLASDLKLSLTNRHIAVPYSGDWSDVSQLCQEQPRPTAIFAGRSIEFDSFINTIVNKCGNNQPAIVADDSVNRFMASDDLRNHPNFNRPLIYVAKSALFSCANKGIGHPHLNGFYNLITKDKDKDDVWHPCDRPTVHPLGERTALTYDAVTAYLNAVDTLLPNPQPDDTKPIKWQQKLPITATTVWARLRELAPFNGVTGVIDFTSNTNLTTGYEPKNKRQALMGVDEISDLANPTRVLFACGVAATGPPIEQDAESAGCPPRTNDH